MAHYSKRLKTENHVILLINLANVWNKIQEILMIEKQTKKLLANEARRDVLNLRHKYCYFNEKRL